MSSESLRLETLELDARVRELVGKARRSANQRVMDTMLFLGNSPPSFPTLVIADPVLESVDKMVWMSLMLYVKASGPQALFPGYERIGQVANIRSRSTVARAMVILRITRWITLCARIHAPHSRFSSSLYALHDKPLPLADACHLDAGYLQFLKKACTHGHARVRAVAKGMLDALDTDHDQNSNSSSSNNLYITTTTTQRGPKFDITGEEGCALVWPRQLSEDQRILARRDLQGLEPAQRQPVLDELEGRIQAEQQGISPLLDELRFLQALCRAVQQGTFHANLGLRVKACRREQEASAGRAATGGHARTLARKYIAEMHRQLDSQGAISQSGKKE